MVYPPPGPVHLLDYLTVDFVNFDIILITVRRGVMF